MSWTTRLAHTSLRMRLSLGLALALIVLWGGASAIALHVLAHEADELFDSALAEVAQRILPLAYAQLLSDEAAEGDDQVIPSVPGKSYISYIVHNAAGGTLLQSDDAETMGIPLGLAPGFHTVDGLRTFTVVGVKGAVIVTTAESLDHRRAALWGSTRALIWPMALLVIAAVVGVGAVVRLSLGPLLAFGQALASRGRGNLTPVATRHMPSEFLPVAAAVNALIGRLNSALQAERAFTANSAHEIRTPIAAALAQSQRLAAELDNDPRRERAANVAASLRRLSRLSDKLLQLAKAEGASVLTETPVPLGPIVRFVANDLIDHYGVGDRLRLSLDDRAQPVPAIDPDAFAILARNLIENAIKHGAAETAIDVELTQLSFRVSNDGPIVPADVLGRMTRPFERGPTASDGSGLGLAIVAAICRGGGVRLVLSSPMRGHDGGFSAEAVFGAEPASS